MTEFTIEPYFGALPLIFGMSPDHVCELLGSPSRRRICFDGSPGENREHIAIGYCKNGTGLEEVVFAPGAQISFRGQRLFECEDAIAFLRTFDPTPYLWVGFVIFAELGIRLSGFHDKDESQLAIGVVRRGYWDEYREDFVPYD